MIFWNEYRLHKYASKCIFNPKHDKRKGKGEGIRGMG